MLEYKFSRLLIVVEVADFPRNTGPVKTEAYECLKGTVRTK